MLMETCSSYQQLVRGVSFAKDCTWLVVLVRENSFVESCWWTGVEIGYRNSSSQAWPPGPVQCFVLFGKKIGEKWITIDLMGLRKLLKESDMCYVWKDYGI